MKKLFIIFTLLMFSSTFLFAKSNKKINVLEFYKACATGDEEYVTSALKNEPKLVNAILSARDNETYLKFRYNETKKRDKKFDQTFEDYLKQNSNVIFFPLYEAAFGGNKKIVSLLIEYGADINKRTKTGRTALISAASWGYKDIVEYLFNKGADINIKDKNGVNALMFASSWGYKDVVEFLCNKGAKINVKDKDGRTSLMYASFFNYPDIVEFLLDNGADLNIEDNENHTALDFATIQKNSDIIKLLQEEQETKKLEWENTFIIEEIKLIYKNNDGDGKGLVSYQMTLFDGDKEIFKKSTWWPSNKFITKDEDPYNVKYYGKHKGIHYFTIGENLYTNNCTEDKYLQSNIDEVLVIDDAVYTMERDRQFTRLKCYGNTILNGKDEISINEYMDDLVISSKNEICYTTFYYPENTFSNPIQRLYRNGKLYAQTNGYFYPTYSPDGSKFYYIESKTGPNNSRLYFIRGGFCSEKVAGPYFILGKSNNQDIFVFSPNSKYAAIYVGATGKTLYSVEKFLILDNGKILGPYSDIDKDFYFSEDSKTFNYRYKDEDSSDWKENVINLN